MKRHITTLIITILFTSLQLTAQNPLQYVDTTFEFEGEKRACIQLNLDPAPKTLKKAWKDYLKDNYDFKLDGIGWFSNKDLLSAEKVLVPAISPNKMDFYTHIVENEGGSDMKIFVRFGYDIYLTKQNNPSGYQTLTVMLDNFLKGYLPKYYKDLFKDTEKQVKDLKDETSDLKKGIEDNSEKIEDLKKDTEKMKKELKTKNELLEEATMKLEQRSKKMTKVNNELNKK